MLKNDPTPMLSPELEIDLHEEYPEEVLTSEWNPALAQVLMLKQRRQEDAERLIEYLPGHFTF